MDFLPLKNIVFRFPCFPVSIIMRAYNDKSFFHKTVFNAQFKEAIFFSSPVLYDEIKKYELGNVRDCDVERLECSLYKYLSRMSTRCTPFGGFACCAVGALGEITNIKLEKRKKYSFRLDMQYLSLLSQFFQNKDTIYESLRYKVNSTLYMVGRRIRYVSYDYNYIGRKYKIVELQINELLRFIIEKTTDFVSFDSLSCLIMDNFDLSRKEISKYLKKIIDSRLIISELDIFVVGEDYLKYLCGKLEKLYSCKERDDILMLNNQVLELNNVKDFFCRKRIVEEIKKTVKKIMPISGIRNYVQLDVVNKSSNISLSSSVISQVMEGMTILNKITPYYGNHMLNDFVDRFLERYDKQEVLLLEALDPNIGVGYLVNNENFYHPLIDELSFPLRKVNKVRHETEFEKILLNKLLNDSQNSKCLELFDSDFDMFKKNVYDLPVTMAAMFRIVDVVDNEKVVLSDLRFLGGAANLLGRFAYCDKDIEKIIKDVVEKESEVYGDDVVVAEINHIQDFRSGNILVRPLFRKYEISYLTSSFLYRGNVVPVSDLMVSVRNNKIVLRSKKMNKIVIPRLTNAHNYNNNPTPLYKFLCDLQMQNCRSYLCFSWGWLEDYLVHLPRVVFKNIILCPEQWRGSKDKVSKNGIVSISLLKDFLIKNKIPRYFEYVWGDNKLFIDSRNELSLKILAKEVSKRNSFLLREFIQCVNASVDSDNGDFFMNECIVPLIKNI